MGDEIIAVNDIDVTEVENAVEDLREALKGALDQFCGVLLLGPCCIVVKYIPNAFFFLLSFIDPSITLLMRSCRDEPPVVNKVTSDAIISSLVVKPPPKIR